MPLEAIHGDIYKARGCSHFVFYRIFWFSFIFYLLLTTVIRMSEVIGVAATCSGDPDNSGTTTMNLLENRGQYTLDVFLVANHQIEFSSPYQATGNVF